MIAELWDIQFDEHAWSTLCAFYFTELTIKRLLYAALSASFDLVARMMRHSIGWRRGFCAGLILSHRRRVRRITRRPDLDMYCMRLWGHMLEGEEGDRSPFTWICVKERDVAHGRQTSLLIGSETLRDDWPGLSLTKIGVERHFTQRRIITGTKTGLCSDISLRPDSPYTYDLLLGKPRGNSYLSPNRHRISHEAPLYATTGYRFWFFLLSSKLSYKKGYKYHARFFIHFLNLFIAFQSSS
jgi:hypothetical protein